MGSVTFFVEHHQSSRHYRFGHRHDDEDGIIRHRFVVFFVFPALRLDVYYLAVARYQRDGPGKHIAIDVALHSVGEALQAFG